LVSAKPIQSISTPRCFLCFVVLGICWAFDMTDQITTNKDKHDNAYGCIFVIIIFGIIVIWIKWPFGENDDYRKDRSQKRQTISRNDKSIYKKSILNLFSNVKLYYGHGEEKRIVGTIICFDDYNYDENSAEFYRAILIKYPNGRVEYKDRYGIIDMNSH